ncbi:MAG: hypothetical protein N3B13_02125 [Deltaproteobacteria bacterium]|nr:hypothetical protein [Deltaproteobacteria bacterium]
MTVMADPVSNNGTEDFFNPALKSAPVMDTETKEVTMTLKKAECADDTMCFKSLGSEADAEWNFIENKVFDYSPITQGITASKKFLFVVGRVKANLPQYEDFKNACLAYVSGCQKLLNAEKICDRVTDPTCLDETATFCQSLEEFCSVFNLENPASDLSGNIDNLPPSWKNPIPISKGVSGDNLNLNFVDAASIGETIRGIAKQKQSLMGNDIFRDFAYAYIDLVPFTKADGDYVSVKFVDSKNKTQVVKLQPTNSLDGVLSVATPYFKDNELVSSNKFYSVNSKTSPGSIEYVDKSTYRFSLGTDYFNYNQATYANLSGDTSIAKISAPPQLNMCLPPPIILDNIYFPTIRWSPLVQANGDLLKAILNGDKTAIDWTKFNSGTGKDVMNQMSEIAKKMVTIYVGAYNRKEYRGAWPQARPLPQIYYHNELRDSIKIFPDIGFFTTTPMKWWEIAPSGRDYMHGASQEIIDYLLDIAVVRADHKILSAKEIYGTNYSEDKANDVAIVISIDIEWQPTIVINSDKLPGGNVTHFWRRDLVGLMVPSYYACPKP